MTTSDNDSSRAGSWEKTRERLDRFAGGVERGIFADVRAALDRVATLERERDAARERAEEVCHMYDHSTGKGNPGVAWVPGSRTADSCHLPREVTVPAEALKEPTDD